LVSSEEKTGKNNQPPIFTTLVNSAEKYKKIFVKFLMLLVMSSRDLDAENGLLDSFCIFDSTERVVEASAFAVGLELLNENELEGVNGDPVQSKIGAMMKEILASGRDMHGHANSSFMSKSMMVLNMKGIHEGSRRFNSINEVTSCLAVLKYILRLAALRINFHEEASSLEALLWVSQPRDITSPWVELCEVTNMARFREGDNRGSKLIWLNNEKSALKIVRNGHIVELDVMKHAVARLEIALGRIMEKILGKHSLPKKLSHGLVDKVNCIDEGYGMTTEVENEGIVKECWEVVAGILIERDVISLLAGGGFQKASDGGATMQTARRRGLADDILDYQKHIALLLTIGGGLLKKSNSM
jgi:hypothetical protein